VNGFRDILGLVDTLDDSRNETFNILVISKGANSAHSGSGSLLDLSLGIPHAVRDGGNNLRNARVNLLGSNLDEFVNDGQSKNLGRPLLGVSKTFQKSRDHSKDSKGGNSLDKILGNLKSIVLDSDLLVSLELKKLRKESEQVRLSLTINTLMDKSLDQGNTSLAGSRSLLVVQVSSDGIQNTIHLERKDAVSVDKAGQLFGGRETVSIGSGSSELLKKLLSLLRLDLAGVGRDGQGGHLLGREFGSLGVVSDCRHGEGG
jgi:hypothetical protein